MAGGGSAPEQQQISGDYGLPPEIHVHLAENAGGGFSYEWLIVGVIVPVGLAWWARHSAKKQRKREAARREQRRKGELLDLLADDEVHDRLRRDDD